VLAPSGRFARRWSRMCFLVREPGRRAVPVLWDRHARRGTMQALRPSGRTIYFFGALGGVLFGYDTGVISGALLFIPNDVKLSPFLQGAIVAGLLLGAMIGAAFAGRLSDRLGRRRLIIIAAVVFIAGAMVCAFAPSVAVLVAGRVILGLAVGSAAPTLTRALGCVGWPIEWRRSGGGLKSIVRPAAAPSCGPRFRVARRARRRWTLANGRPSERQVMSSRRSRAAWSSGGGGRASRAGGSGPRAGGCKLRGRRSGG